MKTSKGELKQTDKTEKVVTKEPKAEEIVETAEILEKVVAKEEAKSVVAEPVPVEEGETKVENGKKMKLTYKFNQTTRTHFPVWEEVEETKK